MRRHAEIAGAGFAGLSAAAVLGQRGWSVRVHEQAPEARSFGAGIWIWDNGLQVFEALRVLGEVMEGGLECRGSETRDASDRVIEHGVDLRTLCFPRQFLHSILLKAARSAGAEIVTSSRAVGADPNGELHLAGGERLKADLVVAADGAHSVIRESLRMTKRHVRHRTGALRLIVQRTADEMRSPDANRIIEWQAGRIFGKPRKFLCTPCGLGVLYLCLTTRINDLEARAVPVRKDVWLTSFPNLETVIARIGSDARWDRFETVKLRRWHTGRVAFVGDAAHSMTPGLGQGAGMSLMNALALGLALDEEETIEHALAAWERQARPLTEHAQRWSRRTWPRLWTPAIVTRGIMKTARLSSWIGEQIALPAVSSPRRAAG